MDKERFIQIIDFWQKSSRQANLKPRSALDLVDVAGPEIVDLVGPRRSGKSSVLKLVIQTLGLKDDYLFINFEDPFFLEHNSPIVIEQLIDVYREHVNPSLRYIFLDEVQEIKHWEKAVRKLRDGTDYKIFLTGSSSQLLSGELASALTGRHKSYAIYPLSFVEVLAWRKVTIESKKDLALQRTTLARHWDAYVSAGGFPEAVLRGDRELLQEYFFDIIQRDVIGRHSIREQEEIVRMAGYLLTHAAKIISAASLQKTFSLSHASVAAYLGYLTDAFLVFPVSLFSYSLKTQQKSLKKWYAIDTGLANAVAIRFSEDRGRQLENTVFMELKRRGNDIYYYKTKSRREVDFVVVDRQRPQSLIEVSWSIEDEKTRQREITALFEAMDELDLSEGMLLTNNDKSEAVRAGKKTIIIMPVYEWALENKEKDAIV